MKLLLVLAGFALAALAGKDDDLLLRYNAGTSAFNNEACTLDTSLTVFCFMSYDCPMSLKQVNTLQDLILKYDGRVKFKVIIPRRGLKNMPDVKDNALFTLSCPIYIDTTLSFTQKHKATVTPQYVLYYNIKKRYTGKLDNIFEDINRPSYSGKYINYIDNAINAIFSERKVKVKRTVPVGCFIE